MSLQLLRSGCKVPATLSRRATCATTTSLRPSPVKNTALRCCCPGLWHLSTDGPSEDIWRPNTASINDSCSGVECSRASYAYASSTKFPAVTAVTRLLRNHVHQAPSCVKHTEGFVVHNRYFSSDTTDCTDAEDERLTPTRKIEKQLLSFMDMWEMKKAIKLLRLAVENNIIPHQNVILSLLQQLANLGEVDFLVEMHQFLLDEKLCSDSAFYTCLQQAYYNSGRTEEGVDFLRKIYHLARRYQEVDVYFVLLTVMILKHFSDKEPWIVSFVTDLAQRVPADHEARAGLWKCYVLTGKFAKAEQLVEEFGDDVRPFLPIMVNDICVTRNKVETDRQMVLSYLLNLPGLSRKQTALLYQTYIFLLMEDSLYRESLAAFDKAKLHNVALKKDNLLPVLNVIQMALSGVESESESYNSTLNSVKAWMEEKEC